MKERGKEGGEVQKDEKGGCMIVQGKDKDKGGGLKRLS